MGLRLPIDAEAVLYNALRETMAVGAMHLDPDVVTDKEKDEDLEWLAIHLLSALYSHGYRVIRKDT